MSVVRWGVVFVGLTVGPWGAAALAMEPPAPVAAPPLRLDLGPPVHGPRYTQVLPGASWDEPAQAADAESDRRFAVGWRDPGRRWDVSAAVNIAEESRLNAAAFQTGGLFETEAAVVRRVGRFRVGAAGYSARGAGESVGRGPRLGQMRWRGSAAGPVIGYDAEVAGQPATLSLRWYREMGTPGESGDTVSAAFAVTF